MKQRYTISTLLVAILAVGLALYMILSFWDEATNTFTTAVAYEMTVSESLDARGVILREEEVLPSVSGLLDVLRTEGEQVGVGQAVGRVYRDASAMQVQSQLEMLQTEARVLEFAMGDERDLITVARMDEEILAALSTLRSNTAHGNYQNLEGLISDVKGNLLRRDYVFGSPQIMKDFEDRYSQVVFEMSQSSQITTESMTTVVSPVSGAYSILVDGLEDFGYSEGMAMNLSELENMLDYDLQTASYGAGKIITGDSWYFITSVPENWAEHMTVGSWVTVRFSGDFSQDIWMRVERLGREEDGEHVVMLSTDRYLEQTTLLRVQSVELIKASYHGLRVPKEALRMEEYTNTSTGETVRSYGVYVLSAGYAEFKPVSIITEEKDFYLVSSQSSYNALRQGNVVVVHAIGLYQGKLLLY